MSASPFEELHSDHLGSLIEEEAPEDLLYQFREDEPVEVRFLPPPLGEKTGVILPFIPLRQHLVDLGWTKQMVLCRGEGCGFCEQIERKPSLRVFLSNLFPVYIKGHVRIMKASQNLTQTILEAATNPPSPSRPTTLLGLVFFYLWALVGIIFPPLKRRDRQIDTIFSVEQGAPLCITRTGEGYNTSYNVEYADRNASPLAESYDRMDEIAKETKEARKFARTIGKR